MIPLFKPIIPEITRGLENSLAHMSYLVFPQDADKSLLGDSMEEKKLELKISIQKDVYKWLLQKALNWYYEHPEKPMPKPEEMIVILLQIEMDQTKNQDTV